MLINVGLIVETDKAFYSRVRNKIKSVLKRGAQETNITLKNLNMRRFQSSDFLEKKAELYSSMIGFCFLLQWKVRRFSVSVHQHLRSPCCYFKLVRWFSIFWVAASVKVKINDIKFITEIIGILNSDDFIDDIDF